MYLFGASGHSKVVLDILNNANECVVMLLDDFPKYNSIGAIPVCHSSEVDLKATDRLIITIGNNSIRKQVATRLNVEFGIAVHSTSFVSTSSEIGHGTVVMPKAIINAEAKIGKHCIINSGAVIEHDCQVEDFVHISPNAALAGDVKVGEGAHVGINACVIQGVKIGQWATVGAGAVVIADVPDFAVVVGNPARIIKYNQAKD